MTGHCIRCIKRIHGTHVHRNRCIATQLNMVIMALIDVKKQCIPALIDVINSEIPH